MQKTFKRYENKYLLDERQFQLLLRLLAERMQPDEYCKEGRCYSIHSIYYDTANHDIIRQSLTKPYYKQKLRLRSYTFPIRPEDKVFLELKKKIGGIVSKRRATMTLEEADQLVRTGRRPGSADYLNRQVTAEIAHFLLRHQVEPKVLISYRRLAFFARDDREFRLTLDSQIRARREDLWQESTAGELLLPSGQYLMEVKIANSLPLWFSQILSQLRLYSTSFSKYGNEYSRHILSHPLEAPVASLTREPSPQALLRPRYSVY